MESIADKLQFLTEQIHSSNEESRRQAVLMLSDFSLKEAKELLFFALGDSSWRVRKEAVDILVAATNDKNVIEELIDLLRSHDNAGLRNSAVESLEKLGRRSVISLCRHASDNDHDVRKFVIDILGNIGDPSSVPLIIQALDDLDPNVRSAAAENLGKIADASALPSLLQALTKNDRLLQFTILEAISRIGKPVHVENLAPLVVETLLKKPIYDCLGAIGGIEVVPLLLEGLKEKAKNAREAAVTAIIKVRERLPKEIAEREIDAQLILFRGSSTVEGLSTLLEASDKSLLEALVKVLGIISDERVAAPLLHACNNGRLPSLCVEAFAKMGKNGETFLFNAFPTADEDDRCFIAFLCGELHINSSIELLRSGMRDTDPRLRLASVLSAGKVFLSELIPDASQLLDDPSPAVREGALSSLCRLAEADQKAVLTICSELVHSEYPENRRNAAILLSSLADSEKLLLLVKDENSVVRKAAISSLARLKSTSSVNHLIMALMDEDSDVRIAAASALGEIGGEDAIDPLILAVRDNDPWVQCAVLKSIAKLRSEKALLAINELLTCAEGPVLITALETVAQIGGAKGYDFIKKALEFWDEEVVKAAIDILSSSGNEWIAEYQDRLLAHPQWDVRSSFVKAVATSLGEKALPILDSALKTETDSLVKGQIIELMSRLR